MEVANSRVRVCLTAMIFGMQDLVMWVCIPSAATLGIGRGGTGSLSQLRDAQNRSRRHPSDGPSPAVGPGR
jgi:hypothetical protein